MPKLIKLIKNNHIKHYFWLSNLLLCSVFSQSTMAAGSFSSDPQYGKGQTSGFMNAMYGTSPDMTEEEIKKIEKSIPPVIIERFFIRAGVNKGSSMITDVKNVSLQPNINLAVIANSGQSMSPKYGGELAFGYKWDNLWIELEVMATENTRYDKAPLFKNQPGNLKSVVKAQGIFANTYYDFINMMMFRAFVGAGIGAGINRTNSNFSGYPPLSTGENFARRRVAGAYNIVLGCKINIVPQLFVSASIRYTNFAGFSSIKAIPMGNVEWVDEHKNLNLNGQHKLLAVSINLMHIFF